MIITYHNYEINGLVEAPVLASGYCSKMKTFVFLVERLDYTTKFHTVVQDDVYKIEFSDDRKTDSRILNIQAPDEF